MNRRKVLIWVGATAAAGLSGCTGVTDDSEGSPTTGFPGTPAGTSSTPAGTPNRFKRPELADVGCSRVHRPSAEYPALPASDPDEFALAFEKAFARATVAARPGTVSTPGFDGSNAEVVERGAETATERPPGTLVSTTVRIDYAKEGDDPERTVLAGGNMHAWYLITDRVVARAPRNRDAETPSRVEGWRLVACADS
jgi:hypothetical protein